MDRQAVLLCSLLSRRGGSVSQCGGELEQGRAELGSVRGGAGHGEGEGQEDVSWSGVRAL